MRVDGGKNIIIMMVLIITCTKSLRVYSDIAVISPSPMEDEQLNAEVQYCQSYARTIAASLEALLGLNTKTRSFCKKRL